MSVTKNVSVSRPDFDEIVYESVSSSLDDNTDQGASEIGLLTESSTATAQTAHCNVPVAASFSIGKALRSKTLKTVPKSPPMLENFWISGPHSSSGCAMTKIRMPHFVFCAQMQYRSL